MLNSLINQGYIVDAADISLLHHPEDYRQTLLTLIEQARERILFNCLYLEYDESGIQIMEALIAAVKNNPQLKVDVFLDLHRAQRSRMGESKATTNAAWYYQELAAVNAQLVTEHNLPTNPIQVHGVPCNGRELFGVYHIKGYVFDDLVLYTGASINNNYCAYSTYRQDRYQLIKNKALADAFYAFTMQTFGEQKQQNQVVALFNEQIQPRADKKTRQLFKLYRQAVLLNPSLQYTTAGDLSLNRANNLVPGKVLVTPVYGMGKNNPLNVSIFEAIAAAKQTIDIYTPYFNFSRQLAKRIIERCKHGVKVRIILSDKVANDFYSDPESNSYTPANSLPYLYELNLRKFVENNQNLINQGKLEVFAWKNLANSYHAKGIAIDQNIYIWTGSNLNQRSFNIDAENALIVYDPYKQLDAQVKQEMEFMLQHVTKITSYTQIEQQKDYPSRVKQTLRRARFFFIDKLAKRLF